MPVSKSAQATEKLGHKFARTLKGGEVLALHGNLGSGKTTFLKGLARGLGIGSRVTSPTFVLMKVYPVSHGHVEQFVHVDCYRVKGAEFMAIGLQDYLYRPNTVVAIEWADKLPSNLKPTQTLMFSVGKQDSERIIRIKRAASSKNQ